MKNSDHRVTPFMSVTVIENGTDRSGSYDWFTTTIIPT